MTKTGKLGLMVGAATIAMMSGAMAQAVNNDLAARMQALEDRMDAAQERALSLAGGSLDHLIPGHDPLVLAAFPAKDGIARVDLPPHKPVSEYL